MVHVKMVNTINILCVPKKLFWKQRLYKILEGQQRVLWYFFKKGLLRFTYQWQTTTNSFKTNPFIFFLSALQVIIESRKNSRQRILFWRILSYEIIKLSSRFLPFTTPSSKLYKTTSIVWQASGRTQTPRKQNCVFK